MRSGTRRDSGRTSTRTRWTSTLVMELEDTYGIAMSEDEAAKIETVGAAVYFVFERLPGA